MITAAVGRGGASHLAHFCAMIIRFDVVCLYTGTAQVGSISGNSSFGWRSVRISTGTPAVLIEITRDFPQFLKAPESPWSLPYPAQVIIHCHRSFDVIYPQLLAACGRVNTAGFVSTVICVSESRWSEELLTG
jgi:hypothetical protein